MQNNGYFPFGFIYATGSNPGNGGSGCNDQESHNINIFQFLINLFDKAIRRQYPAPFGIESMREYITDYYGNNKNYKFDLNSMNFYEENYGNIEYWIGISDIDTESCKGKFKHIVSFNYNPMIKCVIIPSDIDNKKNVLDFLFVLYEYIVAMIEDTHNNYFDIKFAALYCTIWYLFDKFRIRIIGNGTNEDRAIVESIVYEINRDLFSMSDLNNIYEFIKSDTKYCNLTGCTFPSYYKLAGIGERFRLFLWEKNHGSK